MLRVDATFSQVIWTPTAEDCANAAALVSGTLTGTVSTVTLHTAVTATFTFPVSMAGQTVKLCYQHATEPWREYPFTIQVCQLRMLR